MIPFVVIGLVTGSTYAVAGLGLVLSYKTTGVFNFAHGAIAGAAAYVFYVLHVEQGLAWPLAAFVAVVPFGVIAGLVMELLGRTIATVNTATKIAATVGVLLAVQGISVVVFGAQARHFPQFLPTGSHRIGGVDVGTDQLIVVCVALLAASGLLVFFRVSHLGRSMRAVVDDPDLLDLTGKEPARVRRASWMVGCCFSALSGLLIAPTIGLHIGLLTLLVVQAFGAAAIGGFASLPLTYAGGLVVGLLQAISTKYVAGTPALASLPGSVPFFLLFVVLLVVPRHRLREPGRVAVMPSTATRTASSRGLRLLGVIGAVFLLAVPELVGTKLPVYSTALVQVVLFLSLALLVRTSAQVSLCQVGLQAVGAAAFAHLSHDVGLPWLVALLVGGAVAVPLGALIAIPAIRLSGIFLALSTFGLGILLAQVAYGQTWFFGAGGLDATRPDLPGVELGSDTAFYYVLLAAVAVVSVVVLLVERTRLGRLLRGMADSPVALVMSGTNTNVTRVLVFCISSFIAGVSGGLYASLTGNVNSTSFPFVSSLLVLAVLFVGTTVPWFGHNLVAASFAAAAALVVAPSYVTDPRVGEYLPIVFGIVAIAAAVARSGVLGTWPQHAGRRRSVPRTTRPRPARQPAPDVPQRIEDTRSVPATTP